MTSPGNSAGIFVPITWINKRVVVEIDLPTPRASGIAGAGGQQVTSVDYPKIVGKLLHDLPEGLVLELEQEVELAEPEKPKSGLALPFVGKKDTPKTARIQLQYAIMKGKIHAVMLEPELPEPPK